MMFMVFKSHLSYSIIQSYKWDFCVFWCLKIGRKNVPYFAGIYNYNAVLALTWSLARWNLPAELAQRPPPAPQTASLFLPFAFAHSRKIHSPLPATHYLR